MGDVWGGHVCSVWPAAKERVNSASITLLQCQQQQGQSHGADVSIDTLPEITFPPPAWGTYGIAGISRILGSDLRDAIKKANVIKFYWGRLESLCDHG